MKMIRKSIDNEEYAVKDKKVKKNNILVNLMYTTVINVALLLL